MGYLRVDEENQLLWCNEQARAGMGLQRWGTKTGALAGWNWCARRTWPVSEQTREQHEGASGYFIRLMQMWRQMVEVRSHLLCGRQAFARGGQWVYSLEEPAAGLIPFPTRDRWNLWLAHEPQELHWSLDSIGGRHLQELVQPPIAFVDRFPAWKLSRLIDGFKAA